MNNDRFLNIAGITYENKINELYNISKEKELNNIDNTEEINNIIELMAEYEEWKEWARKEAKRRSSLIWGKSHYKPLRKVIY